MSWENDAASADDATVRDRLRRSENGQPGAVRNLVTTVEAVDLLNGPRTIYTPEIGDTIIAHIARVPVAIDGDLVMFFLRQPILSDALPSVSAAVPSNFQSMAQSGTSNRTAYVGPVESTEPFVAMLSAAADYPITEALGTWQANHAYAEGVCLLTSENYVVKAENSGTSGGSEPTWPSPTDTVVDNDITWESFANAPTEGTVVVVFQTSSPYLV